MKNHFLYFVITILLFSPKIIFGAEFNPHTIISDAEMQDYQSMSRGDISSFLREKNSFLSTYRATDEDGKKRRAADIIYRAARESKINPKYLLVKLQKEQSLITTQKPNEKQLDWATGYGVCDSCSFSDPKVLRHKGFATQVHSAAGIIRWYYDNYPTQGFVKRANVTYTIDGQKVTPTSNATAFLYTYTPHIHGNKNFAMLWDKWFGFVYPENSLVKTADDSTVYLLQGNKKRAFKNFSSLVTRFDPKTIVTIPEGELSRYADGAPISLPNYSILLDGETYYLLDFDTLRPFDSQKTVGLLGFNPQEVIEVSDTDIVGYATGQTITKEALSLTGQIVKVRETKELFYLKDTSAFSIVHEQVVKINAADAHIKNISKKDLDKYEQLGNWKLRDATLFKTNSSSTIFVVEKGKKRAIANEETFKYLGYTMPMVHTVPREVADIHETGLPIDITVEEDNEEATPNNNTSIPENILAEIPTKNTEGITTDTPVAAYAILDAETGAVLSAKNGDTVLPMASLVKVVTAAIVMNNGYNPTDIITYHPALHDDPIYNSFRLVEGEKIRAKDAMDASNISSINTASHMLAATYGGEENVLSQMNSMAKNIGLSRTIFSDVSGTNEKSVSTAKEYAAIFLASIKNTSLKTALNKKRYSYTELYDLDEKPDHSDIHTNELLTKDGLPFIIRASKTGYLPETGGNLAMLIERKTDKKKFVIVTLGNMEKNRFDAPENLARWAMNKF